MPVTLTDEQFTELNDRINKLENSPAIKPKSPKKFDHYQARILVHTLKDGTFEPITKIEEPYEDSKTKKLMAVLHYRNGKQSLLVEFNDWYRDGNNRKTCKILKREKEIVELPQENMTGEMQYVEQVEMVNDKPRHTGIMIPLVFTKVVDHFTLQLPDGTEYVTDNIFS